ncbi:hypothetical protein BKA70DRAFT_1484028 [Coprinopsis sp. MPI-PUGE-AT-0042]|nr:hypothetical protein BKA70DRAFT_1484028 [Coprinopsis sp. MPI-PUGE-AT-0042]
MSLLLSEILSALQEYPQLFELISLDTVIKFIDLACLTKPILELRKSIYTDGALLTLPKNVHEFLKLCLDPHPSELPDDVFKLLWEVFREKIWDTPYNDALVERLAPQYLSYFLQYGPAYGLAFYTLVPPTKTCLDPACREEVRGKSKASRKKELLEAYPVPITVFTQDYGSIPGYSYSTYCRCCNTRYYPNYYVHDKAQWCTFYQEAPSLLQAAEHVYIDVRTCQLFTSMMIRSWTSATNCARIYNEGMKHEKFKSMLPAKYSKRLKLDTETVWNSLLLFWLLEDHLKTKTPLKLHHDATSQAYRLQPALKARNKSMVGPGHPDWNHACDLCCSVGPRRDGTIGAIRSVVVDGITIGHPCCDIHDCKEPLASNQDRYCPPHLLVWKDRCAVVGCKSNSDEGFCTCSIQEHRAFETWLNVENKAMFQLHQRLKRLGVSQPDDPHSLDSAVDDAELGIMGTRQHIEDGFEVDQETICNGKPSGELCVASCGVIIGRATFYGSEAPNGVRLFLKGLFPEKASLPGVIWHDNNCKVLAMLENDPEDKAFFEQCAFPVDVFHFKSKHKEGDSFCNANCNPANWPELRNGNKWRFNSSAAEQTNVWFGGYQAIMCEMEVTRYEFFLDEMIKCRNRLIIDELEGKSKDPYCIPCEVLLGDSD